MVYDQLDRLRATQDATMHAKSQWMFTKYDVLNRPIMTGLIKEATPWFLQYQVDNEYTHFETLNTAVPEGYNTNNAFPSSNYAEYYELTVLTVTHYDSYANLPSWANGYSFVNENGITAKNDNLQGQVVATQTRILGTNNFLRSVTYYDDRYRPIQSTSDNGAGGKDRLTRILSFDGKPTAEYHSHTSNVYATALVTKKTYTYDHADRVLKITHKIGSGETVTLSEIAYNELGQPLNKKLHQSAAHPDYLQKLDYTYNIRGWLNGINQPFADGTNYDETDLFNFKLNYNNTNLQGGVAQHNGNIAEQVWKGGYDEYLRGYKYGYDKANRLKTSDYCFKFMNSASQYEWNFTMRYNENIGGYDRNGNIQSLTRYHGTLNIVDQLTYSYVDVLNGINVNDGNRLHQVSDAISMTVNAGFFDGNWENGDYWYDESGNLIFDYNKSTVNVYNHLNLPYRVEFSDGSKIEYLYDAAGNKLQKIVTDKQVSPNKISITNYAGAFVYSNSYLSGSTPPAETLEFIATDEGRIRPKKINEAQPLTAANTKYIYDYFMKDHLGNTRMLLTTEQQTDLYAATQEPANMAKEDLLFNNMSSNAVAKSAIETAGQHFDNNEGNTKVTKLNGNNVNTRVGPSIILKVMAGDTISLSTKAWYKDAAQAPVTNLGPIKDQLLTLLQAGMLNEGAMRHGATEYGDYILGSFFSLDDFLYNDQPYDNTRPKAFLNWLIVDEEFKKVSSSLHAGAIQVPAGMDGSQLAATLVGLNGLTIKRSGWLYIYLSNESNQDVYFDDLIINHKRGPVVEQTNYYSFGLEIPGLHSQALGFGGSENRRKFNGGNELQSKEFSDGTGLTWYDAHFRMYDPQIGRFMQIDAMDGLSQNMSLYSFGNNNPIILNDPLGLLSTKDNPHVLQEVIVTPQNNKAKNVGWGWWPSYTKADTKYWAGLRGEYDQQRDKGVTPTDKKFTPYQKSFAKEYQAKKEWKTNSIAAVLLIGSPILATAAPSVFAGSISSRLASSSADFTIQYALNVGQYGLGKDNLSNINVASIIANGLAPGSSFTSSLIGTSFATSATGGYVGIGNTTVGNFGVSVGLGYAGNLFGSGLSDLAEKYVNSGVFFNNFSGNILGNTVSSAGQIIYTAADQ